MSDRSKPIVIVGAGAIGCFVGCHWAAAGENIQFLGRTASIKALKASGLSFSGETDLSVSGERINATNDASCLSNARAIILAIKSIALPKTIDEIKAYVPAGVPIISLLNGLAPVRDLKQALPDNPILAGMVPYNVAWKTDTHLHRSSAGNVAIERSVVSEELANIAQNSAAVIDLYDDLKPIQYGKLLLNLINPVNALSGQALHAQMSQRGYRMIYAAALREALDVYTAIGLKHQKAGPFPPALIIRMLKLPNLLFNHTALRLQKIDKSTLTSMASDYQSHKPTEIKTINGEVVELAQKHNLKAPINAALVRLIEQAKDNNWQTYTAPELANAVGLKR